MNTTPLSEFDYIELGHDADKALFLLHGTGGDEHDLVPLVESLQDSYNLVGLRGNVEENEMARFFRRFANGHFDQDSIQEETEKLASFLETWYQYKNLTSTQTAFLGYSNGANMILATLFRYPQLISRAVLLHSMLPFQPQQVDLRGKSFLVTYGEKDQMISAAESLQVVKVLQDLGAEVVVVNHPGGHEVKAAEVNAMRDFYGFETGTSLD